MNAALTRDRMMERSSANCPPPAPPSSNHSRHARMHCYAARLKPFQLRRYKVSVATGKKFGSGTDANVHINIMGANGDTGVRKLRKSATHTNMFEAGNTDEFVIEGWWHHCIDRPSRLT